MGNARQVGRHVHPVRFPSRRGRAPPDPERVLELIGERAVGVVKPDVYGMPEAKETAGLARMRFLPVAPRNPTGPVMKATTVHLAAPIPDIQVLEAIAAAHPRRSQASPQHRPRSKIRVAGRWRTVGRASDL